jgi:hypothetical protein
MSSATLQERAVEALICTEPNLEVLDMCWGATPGAGCSQSGPSEPVRCAGLHVVIWPDDGQPFDFAVDPNATACPLAALGLVTLVPHRSESQRNIVKGENRP